MKVFLDQLQQQTQVSAENTERTVGNLTAHVEALLGQSVETNRALRHSVQSLSESTSVVIERMSTGAETLRIAASEFAAAGQGVSKTMEAASKTTANIALTSETLAKATDTIKAVLADYERTRNTLLALLAEFKSVTENVRKDADLTAQIISQIEAGAEKLGIAEKQVEDYLEHVNKVLAEAHASFAEHVASTMRIANADFQKELRTAVDMVSNAIRDLGDTLEDIPVRRR
ncbi:MAG: hypothetical protein ACK4XK_09170 [Casimicrobiaceae bacterium]